MPILGFSESVENKDMTAKRWTNWDTIICLSRNILGKGEIALSIRGFEILMVCQREGKREWGWGMGGLHHLRMYSTGYRQER